MRAIRPGFFVPRWPEVEADWRGEAGALPISLIVVSDVTGLGPALWLLEQEREESGREGVCAAATAAAYASSSTGTMSRNSGRIVGDSDQHNCSKSEIWAGTFFGILHRRPSWHTSRMKMSGVHQ